jgi:hypothetical protein
MGLWICRDRSSACQPDAGRPLRAPVQHPGDHAGREEALPDASLESFMTHCSSRIGEAYFRTPRNTVTAFVNMIAVLQQNPEIEWTDLIERIEIAEDRGEDREVDDPAEATIGEDDLVLPFVTTAFDN